MDRQTFRTIWLPLSDGLYRVAFFILENEDDAKDAVQDFYIKILNMQPEALEGIRSPKAYAVTLLRNMCLDRVRAARRLYTVQCSIDQAGQDFLASEPDLMASREKLRRVLAIIEGLPDKQREVIRQRVFEDKSYEQISKSTGLSENNLRVLLSMARKRIRQEYENC